ncbi:hypothetical protein HPB47_007065 [Ixodes persulcatus]|uniref:Uncharacterized protein n=1 Tax=Ixodes persulcatus TaxID=34615 RepID=A0AC60P8N0_IXOPE|nr:hypothetical protein HPB47_007065 [Ixodes persulcatus]
MSFDELIGLGTGETRGPNTAEQRRSSGRGGRREGAACAPKERLARPAGQAVNGAGGPVWISEKGGGDQKATVCAPSVRAKGTNPDGRTAQGCVHNACVGGPGKPRGPRHFRRCPAAAHRRRGLNLGRPRYRSDGRLGPTDSPPHPPPLQPPCEHRRWPDGRTNKQICPSEPWCTSSNRSKSDWVLRK